MSAAFSLGFGLLTLLSYPEVSWAFAGLAVLVRKGGAPGAPGYRGVTLLVDALAGGAMAAALVATLLTTDFSLNPLLWMELGLVSSWHALSMEAVLATGFLVAWASRSVLAGAYAAWLAAAVHELLWVGVALAPRWDYPPLADPGYVLTYASMLLPVVLTYGWLFGRPDWRLAVGPTALFMALWAALRVPVVPHLDLALNAVPVAGWLVSCVSVGAAVLLKPSPSEVFLR